VMGVEDVPTAAEIWNVIMAKVEVKKNADT
jgi:hypothetical protein